MRKPLFLICIAILTFAFFYAIFSLASLEFNPYNWPFLVRLFFGLITGLCIIIGQLFILLSTREADFHPQHKHRRSYLETV